MARKERKKRNTNEENGDGGGGAGWITTFSDLMSLLLTFFILLFSMATVDDEKFSAASQSMQEAFIGEGAGAGILDGGLINEEESTGDAANQEEEEEEEIEIVPKSEIPIEVLEMYEEAIQLIEEAGLQDRVSLSIDKDGMYLDIQESILFQSSRAEITAGGEETIGSLVGILNLSENDIVVEGFTDNLPMVNSQYPTNWELSTARALSVVHYLIDEQGINPRRLSAKGYGEFSPVAPNDTAENRAKNRRVNIVLVYQPEGDEE